MHRGPTHAKLIPRALLGALFCILLVGLSSSQASAWEAPTPHRPDEPAPIPSPEIICLRGEPEHVPARLEPSSQGWVIILSLKVLKPDLVREDDFVVKWRPSSASDWQSLPEVKVRRLPPLRVNFLFDIDDELMMPDSDGTSRRDNKFWRDVLNVTARALEFGDSGASDEGLVYCNCTCNDLERMQPLAINHDLITSETGVFNQLVCAVECAHDDSDARQDVDFTEVRTGDEDTDIPSVWIIFRWRKDPPTLASYPPPDIKGGILIIMGRSPKPPLGNAKWRALREELWEKHNIRMQYLPVNSDTLTIEQMLSEMRDAIRSARNRIEIRAPFPVLLDSKVAGQAKVKVMVVHKASRCASEELSLSYSGLPSDRRYMGKDVSAVSALAVVLFLSTSTILISLYSYREDWFGLRQRIHKRFYVHRQAQED